jgi:hypothetical protein
MRCAVCRARALSLSFGTSFVKSGASFVKSGDSTVAQCYQYWLIILDKSRMVHVKKSRAEMCTLLADDAGQFDWAIFVNIYIV